MHIYGGWFVVQLSVNKCLSYYYDFNRNILVFASTVRYAHWALLDSLLAKLLEHGRCWNEGLLTCLWSFSVAIRMKFVNGVRRIFPREVALMLKVKGTAQQQGSSAVVDLLDWYELPSELILIMERPVPCLDLYDYLNTRTSFMQEKKGKVSSWRHASSNVYVSTHKIPHYPCLLSLAEEGKVSKTCIQVSVLFVMPIPNKSVIKFLLMKLVGSIWFISSTRFHIQTYSISVLLKIEIK